MPDTMSFPKYIDNPAGGGAVFTNRAALKRTYQDKFNALMVRENGNVKYIVFKDKDAHDSYYIYFKIPSESVSGLYYDVVVRLFTTENSKKAATDLRNYAVQFYSNDPAFTYTFAYAFSKNKMLIKDLAGKLSKAPVKNPRNDVWYVKSLFFAYLVMEKYGLFNRTLLNGKALKYSLTELKKLVASPDKKMQDRKDQEAKLKDLEKKQKQKEEQTKNERNRELRTANAKRTPIVGASKTTRTTGGIKTTKTTKITTAKKRG